MASTADKLWGRDGGRDAAGVEWGRKWGRVTGLGVGGDWGAMPSPEYKIVGYI